MVTDPVPVSTRDPSFFGSNFVMVNEDIRLSPSFTLKDLSICQDAELHKHNYDYALYMQDTILEPLKETALQAETIQNILGAKIQILKGIVCPTTNNRFLNSSPKSQHLEGYALDFTCPEFGSVFQVCRALEQAYFPFDQLYNVRDHVHVSFRQIRMLKKSYVGLGVAFVTGLHNI